MAAHPQQFSYKQSIIMVDDSKLLLQMLKDYFERNQLTKTLHLCYDGGAFIKQFTSSLYQGEDIGLVILDIMMPVLSGVNAAIAMRAIEEGFGRERIPILFFSAKKADEQLISVMKYCAPSHYVCKGASENSEELCERVYKVANNLLLESKLANK
jgi:DNA-binding response OmpR family regulator